MQLITDLTDLYNKLCVLREYISKLGPERRGSELGVRKYSEARFEYEKLGCILSHVKSCIEQSEISSNDLTTINNLVTQIHSTYNKINTLTCVSTSSIGKTSEMATEKFDIRTAISLLPVMTGQEHVSKNLIDGIELYSSIISSDTHPQLINFVLKTRLSPSAKLRLKATYDSIENLLIDLKKYTLPKRSSVAMQSRMQSCKQGSRSIDAFGSELEDLFVNLTIAQAENDSAKYDILRPLNEKIAIKRFSDGLSNSRLSTIIAARQFDSLSEAIRTAIDEQSMTTDNNNHVMSVSRSFPQRSNFSRGYYHNRNNYSNKRSNSHTPWNSRQGQGNPRVPRPLQSQSQRGHVRGARGRTRGAPGHSQKRYYVRHATHEGPVNSQTDIDDNLCNQFFRP